MEQVRISKILSELGLCSRREADEYIKQGQVLLDGKVVDELGTTFSGWQCADEKDLSQRQMLQYDKFVIPLVKAVQELSEKVEAQQKEIEELKS